MKKILPILTLMVVLFCSCGNGSYNERTIIPNAEWAQENKIAFDIAVSDSLNGYVFGLDLRHLENYRYSNLFVFLHTTFPNGNITHDTIECTLAMPDGRWIGKSSGSMRDLHIPLNENLRFPLCGNYHFEIEQAMREPVLKGITDMGIFIEQQ